MRSIKSVILCKDKQLGFVLSDGERDKFLTTKNDPLEVDPGAIVELWVNGELKKVYLNDWLRGRQEIQLWKD